MFDAARLNVFRAVAEHGSISAAAERLSFTQPAVSRQIATLEREAGTQLLERTPRGIRLTDPGRVLLGHAEAILDRMAAARAQLEAVARAEDGRLRIGSFPTANATVVPRAVAAFARARPHVELSLVEATSSENVPALRAGELDLVVASSIDAGVDAGGLEVVELIDDPLLVALSIDHPLARRPRLRLRDLAGETWIEARHADCRRALDRAAAAAGFEPRIRFGTEQWLGKQGLVAAGVGIALIPGLAIATAREDVVLRSLQDGPRRRVVVLLPSGYRTPAAEPFVALLRQEADDHCVACLERARLDTLVH
jgi:DNA-binding transcriptional LysR family regulator